MVVNSAAENVLGTIGTICWTGQIIPQIWKSWKEHSTEGLSAYLVFIWAVSSIPLGVYTVAQNISIPLILQPQFFGVLGALSWTQCLYYSRQKSIKFCLLVLVSCWVIGAGFEVGMVFLVKRAARTGNDVPVHFFGVFASVLIAIGFLPQYWEIWHRKEVIGISYVFITVDALGGVFNLLSLAFKKDLDLFAAANYSMVVAMDSVILVAAAILNPRTRRHRARDLSEESTLQDIPTLPPSPTSAIDSEDPHIREKPPQEMEEKHSWSSASTPTSSSQ